MKYLIKPVDYPPEDGLFGGNGCPNGNCDCICNLLCSVDLLCKCTGNVGCDAIGAGCATVIDPPRPERGE